MHKKTTPEISAERAVHRKKKASFCSRLFNRLGFPAWFFEHTSFFLFQLPLLNSAGKSSKTETFTVYRATEADFPNLALCREMNNPQSGITLFSERMSQGATCWCLADASRQIVGYAWVSTDRNLLEDNDRYQIICSASQGYIFDTFIHPAYRGKNLYFYLINELQQQMLQQAVSEWFVIIDTYNIQSLKAHRKLGAEALEKVTYLAILGGTLHLLSTAATRKCTLGIFREKAPCLSLVLNACQ